MVRRSLHDAGYHLRTATPRTAPGRRSLPLRLAYVNRTLPDGQTVIEEVPLTLEDVLHPQEDDVIPENTQQARDRRYLADVLNDRYVGEPHILVLDDCLIDWGIPGLRSHSPDIGVLQGVRTKKGRWGTFSLRKEGGRPSW